MRCSYWRGLAFLVCVPAIALGLSGRTVLAGDVAPMTMPELADLSGQVIIGRVSSARSYWADDPRRIESAVTFENVEYLKGTVASSSASFTLTVPGGQVGTWQMRVSCTPSFSAGDKWLLFLLPSYRTFPVVGLSQGAFRVIADAAGIERVYTDTQLPLVGIREDGGVLTLAQPGDIPADRCVAADRVRMRTAISRTTTAQSITLADFLDQVRPILAVSRHHSVSVAAGSRETVAYTPVPFTSTPRPSSASAPSVPPTVRPPTPSRAVQPVRATGTHREGSGGG